MAGEKIDKDGCSGSEREIFEVNQEDLIILSNYGLLGERHRLSHTETSRSSPSQEEPNWVGGIVRSKSGFQWQRRSVWSDVLRRRSLYQNLAWLLAETLKTNEKTS